MKSNELLLDAFGRIRETVEEILDGLPEDALTRRPGGTGNSVAWLIWHLSRIQDDHIASAAGIEQVWISRDFVKRFDLPLRERDTGYGHTSKQVGSVKASTELLLEYHDAVFRQSTRFLEALDGADFDRIVDTRWTPHVTLGVRLISVITDCLQHAGQAAYVKGLPDRA